MSVDLSDEDIYPAYENILRGQCNWLLLKYSTRDKLFLSGSGSGGIDELRTKLEDDIYFGFCRVQDQSLDAQGIYVLFSFVPEGISGVKRARSLVHGRAVGSLFKEHQVTITLRGIQEVTLQSVVSKLDKGAAISPSSQVTSFTDTSHPSTPSSPKQPITKSYQMTRAASQDSTPPPTPPKNAPRSAPPISVVRRATSEAAPKPPAEPHPKPATEARGRSQTEVRQRSASAADTHVRRIGTTSTLALDDDPEVQARIRAEIIRLREEAERAEAEAEAEANRVPRVVTRRPEVLEDPFEEKRRRYEEEKEKQRRIALRLLREQQWKEQEEREQRELVQRKAADREKRVRLAREAQEKRNQEEIDKGAQQLLETEQATMKEAASKANLTRVYKQYTTGKDLKGTIVTGYVSIQPGDSISWKRRFYELTKKTMSFYKDDKKTKLLESMPVSGYVSATQEWDEGFEELRAIPHSFAVSFKGPEPPWLFYAETKEDKDLLAALLNGL